MREKAAPRCRRKSEPLLRTSRDQTTTWVERKRDKALRSNEHIKEANPQRESAPSLGIEINERSVKFKQMSKQIARAKLEALFVLNGRILNNGLTKSINKQQEQSSRRCLFMHKQ